jgi:hypothetical protein
MYPKDNGQNDKLFAVPFMWLLRTITLEEGKPATIHRDVSRVICNNRREGIIAPTFSNFMPGDLLDSTRNISKGKKRNVGYIQSIFQVLTFSTHKGPVQRKKI